MASAVGRVAAVSVEAGAADGDLPADCIARAWRGRSDVYLLGVSMMGS